MIRTAFPDKRGQNHSKPYGIMRTKKRLSFLLVIALLVLAAPAMATELKELTPGQAVKVIESVPNLMILDIRTPDEFRSGHLKGARNIDFYGRDFAARLAELDRESPYLVYCRTGRRSGVTIDYLKKLEFKKIYHLKDGITGWKSKGLPLVR